MLSVRYRYNSPNAAFELKNDGYLRTARRRSGVEPYLRLPMILVAIRFRIVRSSSRAAQIVQQRARLQPDPLALLAPKEAPHRLVSRQLRRYFLLRGPLCIHTERYPAIRYELRNTRDVLLHDASAKRLERLLNVLLLL